MNKEILEQYIDACELIKDCLLYTSDAADD